MEKIDQHLKDQGNDKKYLKKYIKITREKMVQYYSTNDREKKELCSFKEALLRGQAPDRGLYMPLSIPSIPSKEILAFDEMKYWEIAKNVTKYLLEDEVTEDALEKICRDAYNFEVPITSLYDKKYVMRLDQGPTSSFKDFAARMMARLMQYFLKQEGKRLVILTATSGDTGGAVADAFFGMDNIDIIILYPKDEISDRQRKQMTTLGENITAIGLDAKFDNCQSIVKEAFADPDLEDIPLSSANSINFGRLLPQTVYYFYAFSRTLKKDQEQKKILFSVPSGNFGDLMGGIIASRMGLPVEKFVVAVNENDEFVKFLDSGEYEKIEPSRNCLSSAMNVGHPSNLARLVEIYGGHLDHFGNLKKKPDMEKMRKDLWSISISDARTRQTIKRAYDKYHYIMEPHGAVGWDALVSYLDENPTEVPCVSFETADPAKFPVQIRELIGVDPEMPENMKKQQEKEETLISMANDYQDFKKFLKERYL